MVFSFGPHKPNTLRSPQLSARRYRAILASDQVYTLTHGYYLKFERQLV